MSLAMDNRSPGQPRFLIRPFFAGRPAVIHESRLTRNDAEFLRPLPYALAKVLPYPLSHQRGG